MTTIDMGRKRGGAAVPLLRKLGPRLVQRGLGRGLLPYQAASSSIQPFVCMSVCPAGLSVTLVYCGQTVGRIKMKLSTQIGLVPGHIVLDGDPAPSNKGAQPPIFGQCLLWQTAGWTKMPLGMEVGLGPGTL